MYKYKAFGLIFDSEIEIPEYEYSTGKSQVKIRLGHVPEHLDDVLDYGVRYQLNKNQFLLKVDNIARYLVENGNCITIDTLTRDLNKVLVFLHGSVMGAIFHQKGTLVFHGSSVAINDQAIIFTGNSSAGKSSIAAILVKKGFQLLSDDITPVMFSEDGKPVVVPSFPRMKLWKDMLEKMDFEKQQKMRVRPEIEKYHVRLENSNHLHANYPLHTIFLLTTHNGKHYTLEELNGMEKFQVMQKNIYRSQFLSGMGQQKANFQKVNLCINKVRTRKIKRPAGVFDEEKYYQLVLNEIKK